MKNSRQAELAQIHIGKKALNWDDSTYRDILWTVCQVKSSADLDQAGRSRFLAHMVRCGWVDDRKQATSPAKPVRKALTGPQKKMWALWQQLADAGLVDNRKMPALMAYVERQTSVSRLEWLNGGQQDLVIESLKKWLGRKPGKVAP